MGGVLVKDEEGLVSATGTLAGDKRDPSDCVGGARGFIRAAVRSLDKRGRSPGSLRARRFGAATAQTVRRWWREVSRGTMIPPRRSQRSGACQ